MLHQDPNVGPLLVSLHCQARCRTRRCETCVKAIITTLAIWRTKIDAQRHILGGKKCVFRGILNPNRPEGSLPIASLEASAAVRLWALGGGPFRWLRRPWAVRRSRPRRIPFDTCTACTTRNLATCFFVRWSQPTGESGCCCHATCWATCSAVLTWQSTVLN